MPGRWDPNQIHLHFSRKEVFPMSNTLYCGVDVAYRINRARCFDAQGVEAGNRLSTPNDGPGSLRLLEHLATLARDGAYHEVRVALEATSFLGWHVAMMLSRPPVPAPVPLTVYLFNAKVIRKFKDTYTDVRKNDWFDARVLADRLRFGHPLPLPFDPDDRYLPLQRLTRHRFRLVKQMVRDKNYFLSYLLLKCNTLSQGGPLSSPFTNTMAEILTSFHSADEIAHAPLDQLAGFIAEKSNNRIMDPVSAARAIQKAARHAYRLPEKLRDPVNRILASTLRNIRHLKQEIKSVTRNIEHEMGGLGTPLLSVPGIGPVFAAGLLAEIGHVQRFTDEASLAKFAGLTWRRRQSGDFHGDDSHLSRTGNCYLRYYLIEAANQVRTHTPEYAAYYHRKYHESKTHHHKRALVLTARKLARLVFALLRENQLYTKPEKRS